MSPSQKANRLEQETSPYLRQHAHNPVDWYPWGEEALQKARQENKPILLSIGYAACHWCHVMAHESFEDDNTAALMNQLFVNIKVDREERPDLDKIYQNAHYLLTQRSGGWPLTVFLTPDDLIPFFSGTYFPPEAKYQLPGFKDVLTSIATAHEKQSQEIRQQNADLMQFLNQTAIPNKEAAFTHYPIQRALEILSQYYDKTNGGFNGAPKFPQAPKLVFLANQQSTMAIETLEKMAQGGINDQLAGGFYRYSVDAEWQIPHFEKMLYDNAQLLTLYAEAGNKEITRAIADWIIADMQSEEGGYYSSLDADSEGHEGKYYVWTKEEIASLLTKEEMAVVSQYFGLEDKPNFEGQYHLHIAKSIETIIEHLYLSKFAVEKLLDSAKEKLLVARKKRIPPALDTKILTSWNALMIKGMLNAAQLLNEPRYIHSAQKAFAFIQKNLYKDKRLLASYNEGKAHLAAYLDDYIFLIDALLTSLEIKWDGQQLEWATDLAETVLTHFTDNEWGGFFFTANDHEKLLYRPKSMMDEAMPSGNGIAVQVLLRLGYLLGQPRYITYAEKTLQAAWPTLSAYPAEHCTLLIGLLNILIPLTIIVIRGPQHAMQTWQAACRGINHYIFAIPDTETTLPSALASKKPSEDIVAYICQGMQCSPPVTDLQMIKDLPT